jgi:hypothetical protein
VTIRETVCVAGTGRDEQASGVGLRKTEQTACFYTILAPQKKVSSWLEAGHFASDFFRKDCLTPKEKGRVCVLPRRQTILNLIGHFLASRCQLEELLLQE